MPSKPNARNWNDVQTALATAAIVTTLGLWNLFATPAKTATTQAQPQEPTNPPPTDPPVAAQEPVSGLCEHDLHMRHGDRFTQAGPQTVSVAAAQPQQQPQPQVRKKKNNNNPGGGSASVTQSVTKTKSS